jgi:hypothetical protein
MKDWQSGTFGVVDHVKSAPSGVARASSGKRRAVRPVLRSALSLAADR